MLLPQGKIFLSQSWSYSSLLETEGCDEMLSESHGIRFKASGAMLTSPGAQNGPWYCKHCYLQVILCARITPLGPMGQLT